MDHCKKVQNHISRVKGQLDALSRYIDEGRECADLVHLFVSVSSSVDSLKAKIVEGYLAQTSVKDDELQPILKLIKS